MPILGWVGGLRISLPCCLVTAKARKAINGGLEREHSMLPEMPQSLSLHLCLCPELPEAAKALFLGEGFRTQTLQTYARKAGCSKWSHVPLPFTGEPHAPTSPGQTLEGVHKGQLLHTLRVKPQLPLSVSAQPPTLLHSQGEARKHMRLHGHHLGIP